MIESLIDKIDTFEQVRDKVAHILATETISQQQLATAAGKDPALWKLRVYVERSMPWEILRAENGGIPSDVSPVVNVWFDTSNMDARASQVIDRQQYNASINVDVIGIGHTEILQSGLGQLSGDEVAARAAQRGIRLARNILAADVYTYLDSRGVVAQRSISSIQAFQPEYANSNAHSIAGMRLRLDVKIPEYAPQYVGPDMEELSVMVRDEDGAILVDALFEYPI